MYIYISYQYFSTFTTINHPSADICRQLPSVSPPSTTGRSPVIFAIVAGLYDAHEASAPSAPMI